MESLKGMHISLLCSPSKENIVARVSCTDVGLSCSNREDEVVSTTQDDQAS